jgi:hypothetical protein
MEETMMNDPQAELVNHYIEAFLHDKGYTWQSVLALPAAEARQLFVGASTYAALKLAEVEDKARLVHLLHHAAG